jgi:conjugative relaxase-like TrwC/TraI family protein
MVTRPNKVFSASYFTRELESARYFLAAKNLGAFWLAGDSRFGVQPGAALDAKHFERLFQGLDANGQSLLRKNQGIKKRVAAYELSVGVSKSVSAAWALAKPDQREAIEHAFAKSLEVVADHVGRNSFTRLGAGGSTFVRLQPNIGVFIQPDTRPALQADGKVAIQPQLHAHICIPNMVAISETALERAEKNYASAAHGEMPPLRLLTRALDGQPLYNGAKSWGAIQHLAFCSELQKCGYKIGEIGPNGTFEILPPASERAADLKLREFWSARRGEIVKKLQESGLTTGEAPALAAKAAVATRRSKVATSEDVFARWHSEAVALGIDVEHYVDNRLGFEMPSAELRDAEIASRMAVIPARLTEFEAAFTHHDLNREISAALVGTGVDASRVDQEAEKLLNTSAILQIGETEREGIFSTAEMIRLEREVVEISGRLAAKAWHRIDRNKLATQCREANLSQEQTAAAMSVASGASISFIEGRAGTGKTTTLIPVCRALGQGFRAPGKQFHSLVQNARVIATSVSWRTSRMLQDELGVEARALDSWLATSKAGGVFCTSNSLVLVDESSQLGVRATHALLTEVERNNACLLFLADRAQTIAISAGSGIELVARAVEAAEISKVVRQKDAGLRKIVEQLAKGDVAFAIDAIAERGCLLESSGAAATVETAVDTYFSHRAAAPHGKHLLICKSNATRLALDSEVRSRLRAEGLIKGKDVTIGAVTPSGRAYRLSLAKGDRIRFGIRCNVGGAGVINGTTATIREVTAGADGHARILADIDGRKVRFSSREVTDGRGRVRLATDYATTIWSSQGLTSDTATIVADSSMDRRDCYVAISRAKTRSVICIDSNALNLAVRADSGFERTAAEISAEERRDHLVRQMSRWTAKSSTLDYVAAPALLAAYEPHFTAGLEARRREAARQAEAEFTP